MNRSRNTFNSGAPGLLGEFSSSKLGGNMNMPFNNSMSSMQSNVQPLMQSMNNGNNMNSQMFGQNNSQQMQGGFNQMQLGNNFGLNQRQNFMGQPGMMGQNNQMQGMMNNQDMMSRQMGQQGMFSQDNQMGQQRMMNQQNQMGQHPMFGQQNQMTQQSMFHQQMQQNQLGMKNQVNQIGQNQLGMKNQVNQMGQNQLGMKNQVNQMGQNQLGMKNQVNQMGQNQLGMKNQLNQMGQQGMINQPDQLGRFGMMEKLDISQLLSQGSQESSSTNIPSLMTSTPAHSNSLFMNVSSNNMPDLKDQRSFSDDRKLLGSTDFRNSESNQGTYTKAVGRRYGVSRWNEDFQHSSRFRSASPARSRSYSPRSIDDEQQTRQLFQTDDEQISHVHSSQKDGENGETQKFDCKVCSIVCSDIDDFDQHMRGAEHQHRLQNLGSMCQLQTQQQIQRQRVQEALRQIEKEDLRTCRVCLKDFVGAFEEHRRSDIHKRKERMTKRGCQLCKTGSFVNYKEYVAHIDSDEHKEAKTNLNKELGQEDFDDKKPKVYGKRQQVSDREETSRSHKRPYRSRRSRTPEERPTSPKIQKLEENETEKAQGIPEMKEDDLVQHGHLSEDQEPIGQTHVMRVEGWYCELCREFFFDESVAKNMHCTAPHHVEMCQHGKFVDNQNDLISVKVDNVTSEDVAFEDDEEDINDANTLTVSEESGQEKYLPKCTL